MLEWYGGVPRIITPDNCKTAIKSPAYYDPAFNRSYQDFAVHYGVAIVPARVRKPKDKAAVEGTVGWLETWLLEWLRGKRFASFEELNFVIRERLVTLAARPFEKRAGSRKEIFQSYDKPALKPLPRERYEYAEFKKCRVPDYYHVEYDKFYYSVPYTYYKQEVTVRATLTAVEVYDRRNARIAVHARKSTGSRYSTTDDHMPENHRQAKEAMGRDGDSYRSWAAKIGPNTSAVIDRLLRAAHAEQTAYRSCMGILQRTKNGCAGVVEAACGAAIANGNISYKTVTGAIESLSQPTKKPRHENLRQPEEFV